MRVVLAVLFALACHATVGCGGAMSGMGGMPMPGGWTMSMTWMRMPGQTWAQATAAFLGMWTVMTAAMMLPSLTPTLERVSASARAGGTPHGHLRAGVVGLGYMAAWAAAGLVAYGIGVAVAAVAMRELTVARIAPLLSAVVVMLAGALQFTNWKARHLASCRAAGTLAPESTSRDAWTHGLRLGAQCVASCAGFTSVLLALGVMDVAVMSIVTVGITAERLAPDHRRASRAVGGLAIAAGSWLAIRAGTSP